MVVVPSEPKPSKREAILQAMLEIVTERGLHDAPMSLVIERSNASAGVVYHHFESKDAILAALFNRITREKSESILTFDASSMKPREAFLQLGLNLYRYYRDHPRETLFLRQVKVANLACCSVNEPPSEFAATLNRSFRPRSEGGVFKDWPRPVLEEITTGLIERLAALPEEVSEQMLREVAIHVWEAVRADASEALE